MEKNYKSGIAGMVTILIVALFLVVGCNKAGTQSGDSSSEATGEIITLLSERLRPIPIKSPNNGPFAENEPEPYSGPDTQLLWDVKNEELTVVFIDSEKEYRRLLLDKQNALLFKSNFQNFFKVIEWERNNNEVFRDQLPNNSFKVKRLAWWDWIRKIDRFAEGIEFKFDLVYFSLPKDDLDRFPIEIKIASDDFSKELKKSYGYGIFWKNEFNVKDAQKFIDALELLEL